MVTFQSIKISPTSVIGDWGVFLCFQLPSGQTKDFPVMNCPNGQHEAERAAQALQTDLQNAVQIVYDHSLSLS